MAVDPKVRPDGAGGDHLPLDVFSSIILALARWVDWASKE